MSPAASTASTTVLGSGNDPSAHGADSYTFGADGANGSGRPGKPPWPHIDDIVSATVDMDIHAPLEKVLQLGEQYFRQAESSKMFGRPDLALADYMRATVIVVDAIPKNKAYGSMSENRKDQMNRYTALFRQVNVKHDAYEKIKEEIKLDNARTGVKPRFQRPGGSLGQLPDGRMQNSATIESQALAARSNQPSSGTANGVPGSELSSSGIGSHEPSAPSAPKGKPAVHPKPAALHGNAIMPKGASSPPSNKTAQDLAERFANLRSPKPSSTQDPRIRTQPLVPQYAGSRGVPASHRSNPSLSTILPELPKVPAAIYSPARGSISGQVAELPSSSSRIGFSRSSSNASNASLQKSPTPDDYFVTAHSFSPAEPHQPQKRVRPTIPDGFTISVEDLVKFMQAGSKAMSILLIDIRTREEFKEGHIMAQDCICIDSSILQREHISAEEIYDSMVLSETWEQDLFGKRHDFDLLVFYDEASPTMTFKLNNPRDRAVTNLFNALAYFDSDVQDNKRFKLLQGGIDAWTAAMGERSLTTSFIRAGVADQKPRPKYVTRPIKSQAEADRWEAILKSNPPFVRDKEEFLRRKPGVSSSLESMSSPVTPEVIAPYAHLASGNQKFLDTVLPSPPSRPAPTVPRTSYSGFSDPDDRDDYTRAMMMATPAPTRRSHTVGLDNPNVWCYANSSLQALFGTPGFSNVLSSDEWRNKYQVPKKQEEKIPHPQLLTKILANLFSWMQNGKFPTMRAKTLMDYVHHIHSRDPEGRQHRRETHTFGSSNQQDAQDFVNFLMETLDDETNILRNRNEQPTQPNMPDGKTLFQGAIEYWESFRRSRDSLVDKYWRGMEVSICTCTKCNARSVTYAVFDVLLLVIPSKKTTLVGLFENWSKVEENVAYRCDKCKEPGTATKQTKLARLPDRLAICIQRFDQRSTKVTTPVEFPLQDLDLAPYAPEDGAPEVGGPLADDRHFNGPFLYDAYAAIHHLGPTVRAGHYVAFIKDDADNDNAWHKFNDKVITPMNMGDERNREQLYGTKEGQAYLIFYQRSERQKATR